MATVDFIEIRNRSEQHDTIQTISKRLTSEQTFIFVDKWNTAKSIGLCKYFVLFVIDITFKDKTKRTFRTNGNCIKEKSDWCFDLDDSNYIEQLWLMAE